MVNVFEQKKYSKILNRPIEVEIRPWHYFGFVLIKNNGWNQEKFFEFSQNLRIWWKFCRIWANYSTKLLNWNQQLGVWTTRPTILEPIPFDAWLDPTFISLSSEMPSKWPKNSIWIQSISVEWNIDGEKSRESIYLNR